MRYSVPQCVFKNTLLSKGKSLGSPRYVQALAKNSTLKKEKKNIPSLLHEHLQKLVNSNSVMRAQKILILIIVS